MAEGWETDALFLEELHPFKPERVGGVELEVQHATPRTHGRTAQEAGPLGNRQANLKGQVRFAPFGWSDE